MMYGMHIGKLIQGEMKKQGVTTKAMAAHCGGITASAVSQWFNKGRISRSNVRQACELLNIDMAALDRGEVVPMHKTETGYSYLAEDLAKMLDAIPDEKKRRELHAYCTLILSENPMFKLVAAPAAAPAPMPALPAPK